MFSVCTISCPGSEELKVQSRCLQDVVDFLPPDGVLVRTRAAGVCHSDLHLWKGHYKVNLMLKKRFNFATA